MKTNRIYVKTTNGIQMTNGAVLEAILPAGKGEKYSLGLTATGEVLRIKGSRINGVGIPRYVTEQGYALAQPGDPRAEALADQADAQEGLKFVDDASVAQAYELSKRYAGQIVTYVPFDPEKLIGQTTVEQPQGFTSVVFDLANGVSCGQVNTVFEVSGPCAMGINLASGWLVAPGESPEDFPRNSDYGGLIERAVFYIANAGLGVLEGPKNLMLDLDASDDAPFARGQLSIRLTNGDLVVVGIGSGDDVLHVLYQRNGETIYAREGWLVGKRTPRLCDAVASIAAVIVRVNEMDADAAKPARKKKAA